MGFTKTLFAQRAELIIATPQIPEQLNKPPRRARGPSVRSIVQAALAAGATVIVEGG
jgi:hypothetical protein